MSQSTSGGCSDVKVGVDAIFLDSEKNEEFSNEEKDAGFFKFGSAADIGSNWTLTEEKVSIGLTLEKKELLATIQKGKCYRNFEIYWRGKPETNIKNKKMTKIWKFQL